MSQSSPFKRWIREREHGVFLKDDYFPDRTSPRALDLYFFFRRLSPSLFPF